VPEPVSPVKSFFFIFLGRHIPAGVCNQRANANCQRFFLEHLTCREAALRRFLLRFGLFLWRRTHRFTRDLSALTFERGAFWLGLVVSGWTVGWTVPPVSVPYLASGLPVYVDPFLSWPRSTPPMAFDAWGFVSRKRVCCRGIRLFAMRFNAALGLRPSGPFSSSRLGLLHRFVSCRSRLSSSASSPSLFPRPRRPPNDSHRFEYVSKTRKQPPSAPSLIP
jgi:hypothetical protein